MRSLKEDYQPTRAKNGRRWLTHRPIINRILWGLHKEYWALATRYEKFALNYLGLDKVAVDPSLRLLTRLPPTVST